MPGNQWKNNTRRRNRTLSSCSVIARCGPHAWPSPSIAFVSKPGYCHDQTLPRQRQDVWSCYKNVNSIFKIEIRLQLNLLKIKCQRIDPLNDHAFKLGRVGTTAEILAVKEVHMSYRVKTIGRQRFKILETRSDIGGYVSSYYFTTG